MIPLKKSRKSGQLAQIFTPCAASRLVAQSQIDSLIANGLEVISCANVPFADKSFRFNNGRC
jgi:hypothetical protein